MCLIQSFYFTNYDATEFPNPFDFTTMTLTGLLKVCCGIYGSYKHWSRLQMCLFCRFSIDRHTDLERQFNINADDGKITLATPLDRELSVWHNITIIATEISKCLGLIPSLCDWVHLTAGDHMTNSPYLYQIFWH